MIRKGNFIVTAVLAAAVIAFFTVFLDPLLKRALVMGGENTLGARVEVAEVRTKIFQGRLVIRGFAAADKNSPLTNLVEFKEAAFQLLPAPLLEKKIVIEEASISDLTWGTPRKTSGALPPKKEKKKTGEKPSVVSQKVAEAVTTTQDFGLSRMEEAKSAGQSKIGAVKPENLASLKVLEEGKLKTNATGETWKKNIAEQETKIQALSEEIKKDIEAVNASDGGSDVSQIAQRAKKIKEIQEKIKAAQKELDETKKKAEADFASLKKTAQDARAAKAKDLEALGSLMGLPSLDSDNIARMLLGDMVKGKLGRVLTLFEEAKKRMPAKKEADPKVEDEKRGVFIVFPKEKSYPTFLWKTASISGLAPLAPSPMEFKGEIKDAAYLPSQWGKPLTALAQGKQGGRELRINALADHRKPDFEDKLELKLAGLSAAGMELGQGKELGVILQEGRARIDLHVSRQNELWKGTVQAGVSEARLEPRLQVKGKIGERLEAAVRSIHEFQVDIAFKGQTDNLDFSLKSDLGNKISEALKSMLSAEINQQKKALEDKVNSLYKDKAAEFEKLAQSKESELLKPLDGQKDALKKLLEQSLGLSSSSSSEPEPVKKGIQKLKKLFK